MLHAPIPNKFDTGAVESVSCGVRSSLHGESGHLLLSVGYHWELECCSHEPAPCCRPASAMLQANYQRTSQIQMRMPSRSEWLSISQYREESDASAAIADGRPASQDE
jgi:hypothetical protein